MGSLIFENGSLVYIDANALIYTVERVEPYRTLLEPLWLAVEDREVTIVSSPLLLVEVLSKPMREGRLEIETQYRELFSTNAVRLQEASHSVFEDAARLRAITRLKTPDAIHAATALHANCALFVTNDSDFRRVQGLPVVVLADLLSE